VFSFAKGTFHPYYVSALIPAVAALCGGGLVAMIGWALRSAAGMVALAVGVVGSALEAVALLGDYAPIVRMAIPVVAAVALIALLVPSRTWRRVGAVAAVVTVLAGPATYSFATVGRSLNGDNVTGGPVSASFGRGGFGGSGSTDTQLVDYLVAHQGSAKYLVAASGTQSTASIIIATGKPVVTIGGFTGSDPAPTVSQLAAMVKSGQLKYVLLGGDRGGPGGGSNDIATWVKAHGKAVSGVSTSGGTLYAVHA
jgi:4-amino-4-deoxy-L-arabinose transferase-like glycosyltransferase